MARGCRVTPENTWPNGARRVEHCQQLTVFRRGFNCQLTWCNRKFFRFAPRGLEVVGHGAIRFGSHIPRLVEYILLPHHDSD